MKLNPWDIILLPIACFIITVLLLFSSCSPDPIAKRQRQEMSLDARIQYYTDQAIMSMDTLQSRAYRDTALMLRREKSNVWMKVGE